MSVLSVHADGAYEAWWNEYETMDSNFFFFLKLIYFSCWIKSRYGREQFREHQQKPTKINKLLLSFGSWSSWQSNSKASKKNIREFLTESVLGYTLNSVGVLLHASDQRHTRRAHWKQWKMICFLDKVTFSTRFHFIKPMNLNYAFRMLCGKCWDDMENMFNFFFFFHFSFITKVAIATTRRRHLFYEIWFKILLIIITIIFFFV